MITKKRTEAAGIVPAAPDQLVTLAELVGEGFGWEGQFVKSPRDAISRLARRLDGEVVVDDIGRLAVSKDTARRLLAERDAAERRQREQAERRRAELSARPRRRPRGVPASAIPEGISPAAFLMSTDPERNRASVHQQLLDEELARGRKEQS